MALTTTYSGRRVNFSTRANVGTVVAFLNDDATRRVRAGDIALVVWDAGKDETGFHMHGRDVLTQDGRTLNIPAYELRAAGALARYFTMPVSD